MKVNGRQKQRLGYEARDLKGLVFSASTSWAFRFSGDTNEESVFDQYQNLERERERCIGTDTLFCFKRPKRGFHAKEKRILDLHNTNPQWITLFIVNPFHFFTNLLRWPMGLSRSFF